MAWAALQIDHDDALRLAPARRGDGRRRGSPRSQAQHAAEREAEQTRAAHAHHVATGDLQMGIAQILGRRTLNSKHRSAPEVIELAKPAIRPRDQTPRQTSDGNPSD